LKTNAFIASPFAKILVYANVFVSLCAAAQVLVTYMLCGIPVTFDNNAYILFVFLSTYLQYNVQRGYFIKQINLYTESTTWVTRHRKTLFYTVFVALGALLFLCNHLSYASIAVLVGAEIVSTAYYMPPLNLRRIGFLKPLIISGIWVVSCAVVPLIENQLFHPNVIWLLLSQFCFISVLSILFDVKDSTDDFLNGIATYSNSLGMKGTRLLCCLLCMASMACFYQFKHRPHSLFAEAALMVATVFTVFITHEKRHRFYFYLWVDGLLILQVLLIYLFLL
jgi:4-hydroxybenzoate polyprenyltransferase